MISDRWSNTKSYLKQRGTKFLAFYLPNLSTEEQTSTLLGIIGILLLFIGLVGLYILFAPPLVSGDEPLHLDYVWLVYNHTLPNFYKAPHLPFSGIPLPPVQWVAQHPPLFYVLLAPFVGPLLAAHHAVLAVLVGRCLSATFGLLAVIFVPYFIHRWGVRSGKMLILSTALSATFVRFIGVSGAIYNDSLATLLSVVSIGIMGMLILHGPKRKYLISLAITLVLCMSAHALLAANVLFGCISIVISYLMYRKGSTSFLQALTRGSLVALAVGFITTLISGWYYVRNYVQDGNFLGSHKNWAEQNLGHTPHTIMTTLHNPAFSQILLHFFDDRSSNIAAFCSLILYISGIGLLVVPGIRQWRKTKKTPKLAIFSLVLLGYVLLTYCILLLYVAGGGSLNSRYLLQCLLPVAFFLGFGADRLKLPGIILAIVLVLNGALNTILNILKYTNGVFKLTAHGSLIVPLSSGKASLLLVLLCSTIGAGALLATIGLYRTRSSL